MILWLNYNGWHGPTWGTSLVVTTPPATCGQQDRDAVTRLVAEIFAPWADRLTVTQQRPADISAGKCLHVVIGGDLYWYGGVQGVSQLGGAWLPKCNEAYVRMNFAPVPHPEWLAQKIAHEAGHAIGKLLHQVDKTGHLETGTGGGDAPIMGAPSGLAARRIWWKGLNERGAWQDDAAILGKALGSKEPVMQVGDVEMITLCPRRGLPFIASFTALDKETNEPITTPITGLNQVGSDGETPVGFQVQYCDGSTPHPYAGNPAVAGQYPIGPYAPGSNQLGLYVMRLAEEYTHDEGTFIIDAPGMKRTYLFINPVA